MPALSEAEGPARLFDVSQNLVARLQVCY